MQTVSIYNYNQQVDGCEKAHIYSTFKLLKTKIILLKEPFLILFQFFLTTKKTKQKIFFFHIYGNVL